MANCLSSCETKMILSSKLKKCRANAQLLKIHYVSTAILLDPV
jgi:hypothetical protein